MSEIKLYCNSFALKSFKVIFVGQIRSKPYCLFSVFEDSNICDSFVFCVHEKSQNSTTGMMKKFIMKIFYLWASLPVYCVFFRGVFVFLCIYLFCFSPMMTPWFKWREIPPTSFVMEKKLCGQKLETHYWNACRNYDKSFLHNLCCIYVCT